MSEALRIQDMPIGVRRIAAERQEQIDLHGYKPADDQAYVNGELLRGACAYLLLASEHAVKEAGVSQEDMVREATALWPWAAEAFKPSEDPRKNLAKAGALIAAEIDRLHAMGVRRG